MPASTQAAGDALEGREAVVGLVDDHDLPLGLVLQIEGRDHPRQHEDRIRAGAKNAPATQPWAYELSPEARDLAFDAGEVLEVGGRRQEEEVDPFRFHSFRQTASPLE